MPEFRAALANQQVLVPVTGKPTGDRVEFPLIEFDGQSHIAVFTVKDSPDPRQIVVGVELASTARDANRPRLDLAEAAGADAALLPLASSVSDPVSAWMRARDEPVYDAARLPDRRPASASHRKDRQCSCRRVNPLTKECRRYIVIDRYPIFGGSNEKRRHG